MISFAVDFVSRAGGPAPSAPLPKVFAELAGQPLVSCTDVDVRLLSETGVHPLAEAVYRAFAEHRPLVLTPDAIWLTIAQGFAQHVSLHSEDLRRRLVRHEGKLELVSPVVRLETPEDWAEAIAGLGEAVRENTRDGIADALACDFSTSTPVTKVAGEIVLLEVFEKYFDYEMGFVCGIPEVTMLGTVDDWRKIERRVEALAKYDLSWWTDWLRPVCRELRRTVEGTMNLDFWRCICMPREVYGGETVAGWIARFFPYLSKKGKGSRNCPIRQGNWGRSPGLSEWEPGGGWFGPKQETPGPERCKWLCAGISLGDLPLGISHVPVRVTDIDGSLLREVELLAGFVGVTQNEESLAVQPHIGWGVLGSPLPTDLARRQRDCSYPFANGNPPEDL